MTCEELKQHTDYSIIEELDHKEIKSLVIVEFRNNRGWKYIAMAYQFIGLMVFSFFMGYSVVSDLMDGESEHLIWFGFGTLFSLTVLVVLHELIHAAAYLLIGARHLSFGMQIRKYLFYVLSDKDVLNYNQFKIVALAPAVVISILTLAAIVIFYQQPILYFLLPIFGLHSLFCSGDFGLLCFFQNRPNREILTFDAKSEGKTYFYGKEIKLNT